MNLRKQLETLLDRLASAPSWTERDKDRAAVLAAYDARAESRTAEQGADVLPRYLFGLAGMKEDAAGPWTPYPLASIAIGNAVAAATRAAFLKAAQMCEARIGPDDSHNAPYNAEDMACAKAIRALADALPAEAPEGRETLRNEAIANTAAQDILIEEMRQITAAMAGIKPNNHQGRLVLESKRNALQHAFNRIGALAASPEAASEVEIEERYGYLLACIERLGNHKLNSTDRYTYEKECNRAASRLRESALAQSTHQAPEGKKDAARYRWLRAHWFDFGTMHDINRSPGREINQVGKVGDVETLDAAIDAALANKENAE